MRFFAREEATEAEPADFAALLPAVDACFADGWRNRVDDLAVLTRRFAQDHVALRAFVDRAAVVRRWPALSSSQAFPLHRAERFHLRLVLWFPQSTVQADAHRQARYSAIEDCHNHSFDFFTTCLFGPGYSSRFLRQVGRQGERFRQGETIPLAPSETVRLRPGDVMQVERDLDFHTQEWPDAYSVTLNLVPVPEPGAGTRQYLVDEADGRVLQVVDGDA